MASSPCAERAGYSRRDLAVSLPGGRRLEQQCTGLGCGACEDVKLAAELVSRACPKERISRRRKQPLILHADNGNSLAAGFRAAIACCDTGDTIGGTRSLEILLQAAGEQRQPLLRIVVPHR